ncbi:hypothetical protein [Motilimonas sp. E26]|uniref:hypothetical protein n=1 Tax=Motilimonas sp. E26 TaxID=2865674 RepID=UPI001E64B75E|nr:hypothetical protein [Motilimonas sp. E26]MCE0559035.1 hypothetical protein [Motilimonas sp. E26]
MANNKPKHICFSITHHGFGHGAISCAVISELQKIAPETKITILSTIPISYFKPRLAAQFELIAVGSDFGMVMHSAISIDLKRSEEQYQQLLQGWPEKVAAEQALLASLKPDLVVSNISPITLAAAANLAIPSVSICPFNWSQILSHYSKEPTLSGQLIPLMDNAYASVRVALKPEPHVPNPKSTKEIEIGPICQSGQNQRSRLNEKLALSSDTQIGLIALGGLRVPIDLSQWPQKSGWVWLVDQTPPAGRPDMHHFTDTRLPFLDLVFSVDVVITKPGYGTYTELALAQTKAITLTRPDWPETPYLNHFLAQHISCAEIAPEQLATPSFSLLVDQVMQAENTNTGQWQSGATQAALHLISL